MSNAKELLPQIRQDLIIEQAGNGWAGEPNWLIHDRIANRYFRLGQKSFNLLRNWRSIEPELLVQHFNFHAVDKITKDDVLSFAQFLYANSLSQSCVTRDHHGYMAQNLAGKKSWWQALIHSYLFYKIPLARPQRFLDATWPVMRHLFNIKTVWLLCIMALIGLYLVSQQWDVFLTTFASFLTFEGFTLYLLSLVIIKTLHELGHAYMARYYDVEVPTIGAAFIVMMPILYTDTSAAWRLKDRRQRLMIDCAGIFTELAIASIATLFWVFLPDGSLRAIAFTIATLSWVMSLTINLNPFMKFDGYYILSDALGFENLQSRGFAIAKWWMREFLFGLKILPPEPLPLPLRNFLVIYSFGVWIYRFFLFLGIALLVYAFFFKLLGIFMFAVEMVWFIGLPLWREIKEWWVMKDKIKNTKRSRWSALVLVSLLLMAIIPWSGTVRVPAIMVQSQEARIHAPFAAKIGDVYLKEGGHVKTGQLLLRLASPELKQEFSNATIEHEAVKQRIARAHADEEDRSQIQVLARQVQALEQKIAGIRKKYAELEILSPHDGIVVDIDPELHPGQWVNETLQLAMVRSIHKAEFKALASEKSRARIKSGATGKFIPDDFQLASFKVTLSKLANISGTGPELDYLADNVGSLIPLQPVQSEKPKPVGAWFAMRLNARQIPFETTHVVRGVIILEASRQSFAEQFFTRIASVLVREAGF